MTIICFGGWLGLGVVVVVVGIIEWMVGIGRLDGWNWRVLAIPAR